MSNIELFHSKEDCCGCGACVNICPKKAIIMREDEYGFVYPSINHDMCVSCLKCINVCAYQNDTFYISPQKVFAAASNEKHIIDSAASGGVFGTIAEGFLKNNGIVYGCAYNEDEFLKVAHVRISSKDDLRMIQGSKYVQSDLGFIFKQIIVDLKNNKEVLFSGTPCQVDAVKRYVEKNNINEKLYTIGHL